MSDEGLNYLREHLSNSKKLKSLVLGLEKY